MNAGTVDTLPESQRNSLLRRVDWVFLLRQSGCPRVLNLASGRLGRAISLVCAPCTSDNAELVVLGRPTRSALRRAHAALRPGGELYCELALPQPAGAWRARRTLARAGFDDIRIFWPGPRARRAEPQFWLPLDSPGAIAHLLAERPPRNLWGAFLRRGWLSAARTGMLARICVLARRAPSSPPSAGATDEIDAIVGRSARLLLLTSGERSINKVVGLTFDDRPDPHVVVKFARVPGAEAALSREADALQVLQQRHPSIRGVPRVLATGRRNGRLAVCESAVQGSSVMSTLSTESFPRIAHEVTRWLIELAASSEREPPCDWWPRLVEAPLAQFECRFGSVVDARTVAEARGLLAGLGSLPIVFEHRDCAPWNVVMTAAGTTGLLDWESAEPRGLPVLDLVYFLANAAFVLDSALEKGSTRESYARMLDPGTSTGRVAAQCLAGYCGTVGVASSVVPRLRLLTWVVHSRSDYRHLELDAVAAPADRALRTSVFLGLVQDDLRRVQARG